MELLFGLFILAGIVVGAALLLKATFWIVACVVLPVFWLWMLVDACLRKESEYPSRGVNEKILWIVLMIVIPIAVIAYWFLVYKASRRDVAPAAYSPAASPQVPSAPPPPPAA